MPPSTKKPIPKAKVATAAAKTTKPVIKETNQSLPVFRNVQKVDINAPRTKESVLIASGTQDTINQLLEQVDAIKVDDINALLTEEELTSIGFNYESTSSTVNDQLFYQLINKEDFVNEVTQGDKVIGINPIKVNAKGKLTGDNAVAKFTSRLGIGKHTSVTLWHSGFTLILAPAKESEIINLQYAIAKLDHRLGKETNNFIYSNYGVLINKLLVDFILDHVIASSLTLPEDKSYIDYIKLTDLNTLAAGMATSMRPNGYPITVTCKNSLTLVDQHPVCDFTATADVSPESLLWVNRKVLTPTSLAHISKTSAGSHTVEDIEVYQASLTVNDSHLVTVTNDGGDDIVFNIQTPTLRKYIDCGELWVNTVIASAESLFTEDESIDKRNDKIDTIVLASILNKYNHYITSIELDESYVDDSGTISSILEVMSSDGVVSNNLLKAVTEHIDSGYVSLIATYNFDCPKCKDAGRDSEQYTGHVKGFKEFIPLNAVEHFFDLSTLRFIKITNREK